MWPIHHPLSPFRDGDWQSRRDQRSQSRNSSHDGISDWFLVVRYLATATMLRDGCDRDRDHWREETFGQSCRGWGACFAIATVKFFARYLATATLLRDGHDRDHWREETFGRPCLAIMTATDGGLALRLWRKGVITEGGEGKARPTSGVDSVG